MSILEIERKQQEEDVEKECAEDEEKAKELGIDLGAIRFLPEAIYIEPTLYPLAHPTLEYMWRTDTEGNLYRINMRIPKIIEFYTVEEQRRGKPHSLFVMGDTLYAEREGHLQEVVL